jgi:hypothetical protein
MDGEMDGRAFRQIVEIRSEGGTTVLRLVHSGFGSADPDSEIVQGIDSGWTMALALIRHYVERYFGRDKESIAVFRPARYDYGALLAGRYLDADGLGKWLTDGAGGLDTEGPVHLRLRSGRTLTGAVLARTDHEVSIAWDEIEGVLELKAFGVGPDARVLGVRVVTWGADPGNLGDLRTEAEEAVDSLIGSLSGSGRAAEAPLP